MSGKNSGVGFHAHMKNNFPIAKSQCYTSIMERLSETNSKGKKNLFISKPPFHEVGC